MKRYENYYCPNCKKKVKFENFPRHIGPWRVLWKFILGLFLFLFIPFIGWIFGVVIFASIFTDKKGEDEFYCSKCGTKVIIKKG